MKRAATVLRLLLAVLTPVAVALVFLWFGRAEVRRSDVPAPGEGPEVPAVPAPRTLTLRLERPGGAPASGAVVLFTAPVPQYAEADAQGRVRADFLAEGEVAFLAHARGCRTLRHRASAPLPESMRFAPLEEATLAPVPPVATRELGVALHDRDGGPVAGALIVAHDTGTAEPEEEPWIAFTDDAGAAVLSGVTHGALLLEAFAPGMPPRAHARLAMDTVPAGTGGAATLAAPVARLQLRGLAPDGLLYASRVDVVGALPMRLVPGTGTLTLGPLPPGRYHLRHEGRELLVEAPAGTRIVSWRDARPVSGEQAAEGGDERNAGGD